MLEDEFRHVSSVPEKTARVCDDSAPKVPRNRREFGTERHTPALVAVVPSQAPTHPGARVCELRKRR